MQKAKEACVELTALHLSCAEKELAAFAQAVQELFGEEQARQSVEDWMDELEGMDRWGQRVMPSWRSLTIAAVVRLSRRVNVLPHEETPNKRSEQELTHPQNQ